MYQSQSLREQLEKAGFVETSQKAENRKTKEIPFSKDRWRRKDRDETSNIKPSGATKTSDSLSNRYVMVRRDYDYPFLTWYISGVKGEKPSEWHLYDGPKVLGNIFRNATGCYLARWWICAWGPETVTCYTSGGAKKFLYRRARETGILERGIERLARTNNHKSDNVAGKSVVSQSPNLQPVKAVPEEPPLQPSPLIPKVQPLQSKPLILRKEPKKEAAPLRAGYLRNLKIFFGPNPKLISFATQEANYKLATNEYDGIDSYFDYEGVSPNEVTMGIDFGTSTVKVVFHDPSIGESGRTGEAVPFLQATGIEAYLLPTKLWFDSDGNYSLTSGAGECYSKIKLDFMNQNPTDEVSFRFKVFLALVIRHARSWYYKQHSFEEGIQWNVVLGCPSSIEKSDYLNRWKRALLEAWILAEKKGPLTWEYYYKWNEIESELETERIKSVENFFSAVSEVQAEAYAFIEDYPRQDSSDYIIVDIGSSTVDIASFSMTKSPRDHVVHFYLYDGSVENLGTTKVHHHRLKNFWKEAFEITQKELNLAEPYGKLILEINKELSESLRGPLPNALEEYFSDVTLADRSNYEEFEWTIRPDISRQLKRIADSRKNGIPIILCGGGSRSKYYSEIYEEAVINGNMVRLEPIRNLVLETPILPQDYDRLLVAYGLATIQFEVDTQWDSQRKEEEIIAERGFYQESYSWEDNYISKDMV